MMITFVSQCNKKALNRTRRVLDSFADRIGDNTWQTVITQEGLDAVKKLLRKTASKNTAVSCHWIRSRSRSELVWVVGNKRKYNSQGLVPVNYTSREVIMDKLPIETGHLLANTRQQTLSKHLFAVGLVAYQLLDALHIQSEKLKQAAFISGVCHDLGKIDPEFQNWVNKKSGKVPDDFIPEDGVHIDMPIKFSFDRHPRHHEISWILAEALLEGSEFNNSQRQQIAHAIYWHHTKPYRKDDKFTNPEAIYSIFKKSLTQDKFDDIYRKVLAILNDVTSLVEKFEKKNLIFEFNETFSLTTKAIPEYKKYDSWIDQISEFQANVRENALNNLVRAAVVSADRLISSCSADDLEEYLAEGSLYDLVDHELSIAKNSLKEEIKNCLKGFESRYLDSKWNQEQQKAAKKIAELKQVAVHNESANIGVLQGPAGCGKTKIALEWAMNTEVEKIIWVCPRVQVCLGLLLDLTANDYLPNSKIEIFTGEYKKIVSHGTKYNDIPDTEESEYFSGDIVITTIDQVINTIITHHKVTTIVDLFSAHVVFDEYHELVNMPAFNLLFAELIEAKKHQGAHANTLLVSATPQYFYLTKFLGIPSADIITIDSFNQSRYRVEFKTYDDKEQFNPLVADAQTGCTFVITNTALDAQLGYLQHHMIENSVLLHSKYTKQDKTKWFDQVFESFKRNGTGKYDILRSGPIIQASLNISCDRMLTEPTSAENWLQRLGRLDRFGQNSEVNPYITILPRSIELDGKMTSQCAKFLNQLCIWQSTKAWLNFLKDQLADDSITTVNQLYGIYQAFYADESSLKWIEQDFLLALKKSVDLINKKLIDPISVPPKSKKQQGIIKISANSLRGDNRFVQMAECKVTEDLQLIFTKHYAYSEEFDPSGPLTTLTESIEAMRGFGEDDNNLVQFMQKKHHNIQSEKITKKARSEWELIKEARSPEFPIYLSYTPQDLSLVNSNPHPKAVYYVISCAQPVGAMRITKLQEKLQPETVK